MVSGPFSRRAAAWVSGTVLVSVFLWLIFLLVGQGVNEVRSSGNDAYSTSAVGHRAFCELLRRLGVPVTLSRFATAGRVGSSAVLVVAEPDVASVGTRRAAELEAMLEQAAAVLLVLPKWDHQANEKQQGWIRANRTTRVREVARILDIAGVSGEVVRLGPEEAPEWSVNRLGVRPEADRLQLVRTPHLEPLVSTTRGTLLGTTTRKGRELLVLSDPDLLSNHGLARGANAEFVVKAIRLLGGEGQPVIVDETLHGHEARPALWAQLFGFPLVLATLQVLLILGSLVWAGSGRFGTARRDRAGLAPGTGVLIDNTAELLLHAGHSTVTLERYLGAVVSSVARVLHAPGVSRADVLRWLAERGARRGVATDIQALAERVKTLRSARHDVHARILSLARRAHRWKEEMLDGPGGD